MLEDAVAIAESAGGRLDALQLAALPVEHLHIGADAGQLDPVGTDILHRGGPDRARDQRQVLEPEPALLQAMAHQLMPVLASRHVQQPVIPLVVQRYPLEPVEHYDTGEVIAKQHVAATAQHQPRQVGQLGVGYQLRQIVDPFHFGQPAAMGIEGEGVERQ